MCVCVLPNTVLHSRKCAGRGDGVGVCGWLWVRVCVGGWGGGGAWGRSVRQHAQPCCLSWSLYLIPLIQDSESCIKTRHSHKHHCAPPSSHAASKRDSLDPISSAPWTSPLPPSPCTHCIFLITSTQPNPRAGVSPSFWQRVRGQEEGGCGRER